MENWKAAILAELNTLVMSPQYAASYVLKKLESVGEKQQVNFPGVSKQVIL